MQGRIMNWLLGRITGNPMLLLWIALGAFAFGLLTGGGAAWKVQGWRLEAVQTKFDAFVASTKAIGEQAQRDADKQQADDKRKKEESDAENKRTLADLRGTVKRLRDARAGGNFLPASTTASGSPDRACFDRTSLESAIRGLDTGVQSLVDKGGEAVVKLNSVKLWALKRSDTLSKTP